MKKILYVTSTRADFGLIYPFYNVSKNHNSFETKILVTGTHTLKSYGLTINEIIHNKVFIDYQLSIFPEDFKNINTTTLISNSLLVFSSFLEKHQFDYIVLLGDRFEIFTFALAAFMFKIPIIHLYGGETTEGAYDEAYRHMITKMSLYHLTSTEKYRRRVVQMGEDPSRVINIGAIGVQNILQTKKLPLEEISKKIGRTISLPFALVTFHPETMNDINPLKQLSQIVSACKKFPQLLFIFSKTNADFFGQQMNFYLEKKLIEVPNAYLFDSLGTEIYLSLMSHAKFIMGNSSSGLIEAPVLNVPVINLGIRQKGRLAPKNVINLPIDSKEIEKAIHSILSNKNESFIDNNLYGTGKTTYLFSDFLTKISAYEKESIIKTFYDMKGSV